MTKSVETPVFSKGPASLFNDPFTILAHFAAAERTLTSGTLSKKMRIGD